MTRVSQQDLARLGQAAQAAFATHEQRALDQLLQTLDLDAHSGLGSMEMRARLGEALRLDHGDEGSQQLDVEARDTHNDCLSLLLRRIHFPS